MFTSIADDVKREIKSGNPVSHIIFINIGIFLFVVLARLVLTIGFGPENIVYSDFLGWITLRPSWQYWLLRPTTWLTYMFTHEALWHIFWNMIFLYWFGQIFRDFAGPKRVWAVYIYGGLIGGVLYIITAHLLHFENTYCLGASAGIMSMVLAAATIAPDYTVHLLFLGAVRLKYIAAFLLVLDLVSISVFANTGGHFAHLGGAFMGWFFVKQLYLGRDLAVPFNRLIDGIGGAYNRFLGKPRMRVHTNNSRRHGGGEGHSKKKSDTDTFVKGSQYSDNTGMQQEKVDVILEKIKKSGYSSLTDEEKEYLFKVSKDK